MSVTFWRELDRLWRLNHELNVERWNVPTKTPPKRNKKGLKEGEVEVNIMSVHYRNPDGTKTLTSRTVATPPPPEWEGTVDEWKEYVLECYEKHLISEP